MDHHLAVDDGDADGLARAGPQRGIANPLDGPADAPVAQHRGLEAILAIDADAGLCRLSVEVGPPTEQEGQSEEQSEMAAWHVGSASEVGVRWRVYCLRARRHTDASFSNRGALGAAR